VGEKFELEVYDGNSTNGTFATLVDQSTVVNQAVTPTSSTGHELYIRFRYNGRTGATVKFVITDDKGKIVLMVRRVICFIMKASKTAYTWTLSETFIVTRKIYARFYLFVSVSH